MAAQCGWRLPWRRVLHLLLNWRWWLGSSGRCADSRLVAELALSAPPHGSVHAQEARVALKLAASYLLAVGGWLLLLAWAGVLFGRQKPLPKTMLLTELFDLFRASRRWIGVVCCLDAPLDGGASFIDSHSRRSIVEAVAYCAADAATSDCGAGLAKSSWCAVCSQTRGSVCGWSGEHWRHCSGWFHP